MDNDSTNESIRQLSDLQEKVLAILPLPSAMLSLMGSTIILLMALESRKRKQWTPYTRLLVGLSVSDILYSISISISSFLRPKETSNFVYSMGNDASCNASGFINQLGVSAIWYNAALSFYFLATARFGVSAKQFSRRMEKVIHLISIGHPIVAACIGAYLGLYAERRGIIGCYLENDNRCRSEDPEVRALGSNCSVRFTRFLFYIIPAVFTLLSLIVNNIVISRFVQNKVKRRIRASVMNKFPSSRSITSATDDMSTSANTMRTEVAAVVEPKGGSSRDDALLAAQRAQHRRLKLIRSQAFLFVASYFFCHIWSVGMATGDSLAKGNKEEMEFLVTYYPLAILQSIFQPLQGLLNMIVFVRPKYLKSRTEFPRETKWWAFQRAIFGEKTPPTHMDRQEDTPRPERKGEKVQSGHVIPENNDKSSDAKSVGDGSHASDTSCAYSSRLRENVSTLTASLGDFDHVIEEGVQDERWTSSERPDVLTSWVLQSSRHSTSSVTLRASNLEVISELVESVFEAFPIDASSINGSVVTSTNIRPEQREGRWSTCDSPCTSPRSVPTPPSHASSDTDSSSTATPDSPSSRWSSESPKTLSAASTPASILPLPRRVESLSDESLNNDESSASPKTNKPKYMPSLSPPLVTSSGHSVSSCTSSAAIPDSPLTLPRRRMSPPPVGNK